MVSHVGHDTVALCLLFGSCVESNVRIGAHISHVRLLFVILDGQGLRDLWGFLPVWLGLRYPTSHVDTVQEPQHCSDCGPVSLIDAKQENSKQRNRVQQKDGAWAHVTGIFTDFA